MGKMDEELSVFHPYARNKEFGSVREVMQKGKDMVFPNKRNWEQKEGKPCPGRSIS
jgi:hypothetical protein